MKANSSRSAKARRFAICVDNSDYPAALELHKLYRIVPDRDAEADGDVRVIDESGEDYLYPASFFLLVELSGPVTRALQTSFERAVKSAA